MKSAVSALLVAALAGALHLASGEAEATVQVPTQKSTSQYSVPLQSLQFAQYNRCKVDCERSYQNCQLARRPQAECRDNYNVCWSKC